MTKSTRPDSTGFGVHHSDLTAATSRDPTQSIEGPSDPLVVARQRLHRPQQIGPYRILDELGEGGMGVVYLAEQDEPIHRRVALKVIKLGMDTKQTLARFETEREALALMNHPGVAKVLDAGSTNEGRPYFVMEHVPGISITEYCDLHRLNTDQRLHLFVDVCQAVQHAHQKGIIHRDIKPSNVLVMVQDDKPIVKVIDFGVAKATQHRLTERTLFTEEGQFLGTPGYTSPEQASMTALDIDTRSDIYSLGVLLYELLVGTRPFDRALRGASLAEIQRVILEVEPPRPSTKFSLGVDSTEIARKRHTEPRALQRELRGDLDWIIMKCLEKDRTRRYATANALAFEIQRHLSHEPVLARPPTLRYRTRKFVRRNRAAVSAAAVLAVAFGLAGYFYVSARQAVLAMAQAARYAQQAKNLQLQGEAAPEAVRSAKYRESRNYAERALALDPSNSLALRTKAFLLLEGEGDFQAALEAYNDGLRPLEDARMLPEDFHNRARLKRMFGQYEEALKDHNRAIALNPEVARLYASQAITQRFLRNIDAAIHDLAIASKLDSTWALQGNLWTWEMRMLRRAPGDTDAAASALAQAQSLKTNDPFDRLYLDICRGAVTPQEALSRCSSEEQRFFAYYYLGAKALVDGQPAQAKDWFPKCVACGLHQYQEFDLAQWHIQQAAQ